MSFKVSYLVSIVRKELEMKEDQAVTITVNNALAQQDKSLEELYKRYKDEDGFLYLNYSEMSAFGHGLHSRPAQ